MERRALPVLAVIAAAGVLALTAGLAADPLVGAVSAAAALGGAMGTLWLARRLAEAEATLAQARAAADVATGRADAEAAAAEAASTALAETRDALIAAESGPDRGPETVFDPETGLLDERVFVVSFERKVAAARRHLRPLCLVLLDLSSGLPDEAGERRRALGRFGTVVRETLRDADIACRLGPATFGLILEDTPESGGVWAAERLQIAVACAGGSPTRVAAAVAAYPNHGLAPHEVLGRAQEALSRARTAPAEGMGAVEVATSDLS